MGKRDASIRARFRKIGAALWLKTDAFGVHGSRPKLRNVYSVTREVTGDESFSKPPRTFASMYPDSITLKTQRAPFSWYLASNRTASGFEGLAPNGRRDTTSTSSVALSTRADRVQSGRGL